MKLTKEECLEALRTIEEGLRIDYCKSINYVIYHGSVIKIDILKQLIDEHFELEKALDKACVIISNIYDLPDIRWTFSADEWKEYLLDED